MSNNPALSPYLTCSSMHTPVSIPLNLQDAEIDSYHFDLTSASILVKVIHNKIQTRIQLTCLSFGNFYQTSSTLINCPGGTVSNVIVVEDKNQSLFRLLVISRLNGLMRYSFNFGTVDPYSTVYTGLKLFEDRKFLELDFSIHIEMVSPNKMLLVPKFGFTPVLVEIPHGVERELKLIKNFEVPRYVRFSFLPDLISFAGSRSVLGESDTPKYNLTSTLQLPNGMKFLFWLYDYDRIYIWDLQTNSEIFSKPLLVATRPSTDAVTYKELDWKKLKVHSIHTFMDASNSDIFYFLIAFEGEGLPFLNIFKGKTKDSNSLDVDHWDCCQYIEWDNWSLGESSSVVIKDIHLIHQKNSDPTGLPSNEGSLESLSTHNLTIWMIANQMEETFVSSIDFQLNDGKIRSSNQGIAMRNYLPEFNQVFWNNDDISKFHSLPNSNKSIPDLLETLIDELFCPYRFNISTLVIAAHRYSSMIESKTRATNCEIFFKKLIHSKLNNFIAPYQKHFEFDQSDILYEFTTFISICQKIELGSRKPCKIVVLRELGNQIALLGTEYINIVRLGHQLEWINSRISGRLGSQAILRLCSNNSNPENILLQGPCKQKGLYTLLGHLGDFNQFLTKDSRIFDTVIKEFESNYDECHFSLTELYSSEAFYHIYIGECVNYPVQFKSLMYRVKMSLMRDMEPIQVLIDLINIFKNSTGIPYNEHQSYPFGLNSNKSDMSFVSSFLSNTSHQLIFSGFQVSRTLLWFLIYSKSCIKNDSIDTYISQCISIHLKYARLYQLLYSPIQRFLIGSASSLSSGFLFPYVNGPLPKHYYQIISNHVPTKISSLLEGFIGLFDMQFPTSSNLTTLSWFTSQADQMLSHLDLTAIDCQKDSYNMAFMLSQWLCYHHKSPKYALNFLSTLKPHPILFYFKGALEAKIYGDKPGLVKSFRKASALDVFYPQWNIHPLQFVIPSEYFQRGVCGYFFFLGKHFEEVNYFNLALDYYQMCLFEFDTLVKSLQKASPLNTPPRTPRIAMEQGLSYQLAGFDISQDINEENGTLVEFNRDKFICSIISCYTKLKLYKQSLNYLNKLENPRLKSQLIKDLVNSLHEDNKLSQLLKMPFGELEWDLIQIIKQKCEDHSFSKGPKIAFFSFLQTWYIRKHDWESTISSIIDQIVISIKYAKMTSGFTVLELKKHMKLWKKVIKYFKRLPIDTTIEVNYYPKVNMKGWLLEPQKMLFTIQDAIKNHQISIHRFKLSNRNDATLDPFQLASCQELVQALIDSKMVYRALDLSIYYQLGLSPILRYLTDQIIKGPSFPPNRFLSPDPFSSFKDILLILEMSYVPKIRYFQEPPKYDITMRDYTTVIETLISCGHHKFIPPRLSSFVRNKDFNLLLDIYCKYSITKEVGELAIEYIENIPLPKADELFNRNTKFPLPLDKIQFIIGQLKIDQPATATELERVLENHLSQLESLEMDWKMQLLTLEA